MERALVSYDDIQGPALSVPSAPVAGPSASPSHQQNQPGQPPRKKRRNNKQNRGGGGGNNNYQQHANVNGYNGGGHSGNGWGNRQQQQQYAHWDDPASQGGAAQSYPQPAHPQLPPKPQTSLPAKPIPTGPRERVGPVQEEYYEEEGAEDEEGEGEEEMSRMLTREEIWDDSALIDAWDSAMAEYEAMHGKSKGWKDEPVKKSALWYNVPPKPAPSKPDPKPDPATESTDSQPFDFNTFVPSHDPSLGGGDAGPDAAYAHGTVAGFANAGADGEVAWAGRDAAFGQAMSAMYWAGYWTAVYHSHDRADTTKHAAEEEADGEYAGEEGEEDEEDDAVVASPIDEDIIPTQR